MYTFEKDLGVRTYVILILTLTLVLTFILALTDTDTDTDTIITNFHLFSITDFHHF